jgi:4,5-dihydroxyphthalate decarboxylase
MRSLRLSTLIGDHAVTRALKGGEVASPHIALDFADVKVPNTAFKRVVRNLEFDVAELAIVTFLMAKAQGVPLSLLPAVLLARFQHPYLLYDRSRGRLAPADLDGRRVGIRSYTVTTVAWIRAVLANDHGVDLDSIRWISFEEAHVAGFTDPPNVERARPEQDLLTMLLAGEIDAAVIAAPVDDPRIGTLIPDPAAAAKAWQDKYGAIQLNHLVAVKSRLCEAHPDAVREVYRLLEASKRAAGLPPAGGIDLNPFGIGQNRRNLEVAIDMTFRQRLIPRRLEVDELFDGVTRSFA